MSRLVRALSVLVGLAWIFAAVAKVVDPAPAYELSAVVVGGGLPARAALGAALVVEAFLGTAMVLGAVVGFRLSLCLLAALSAVAWWVSEHTGPWVPCGCLGGTGTVADALVRNAIAGGVLLVLCLLPRPRPRA